LENLEIFLIFAELKIVNMKAKEEIVSIYTYIKGKIGLKVESLKTVNNTIDSFFKLLEEANLTDPEIVKANCANNFLEAVSEEWLFLYIAFHFQNDINYKTYKAGLENKTFDWVFYLSGFCTKKALYIYEKKKPQWLFFVERDLLKKYKFNYQTYLSEVKGESTILEPTTPTSKGFTINRVEKPISQEKITLDELLPIEDKERLRFLNTEQGLYHCITEEIYFKMESDNCKQCKFKIECQERVW